MLSTGSPSQSITSRYAHHVPRCPETAEPEARRPAPRLPDAPLRRLYELGFFGFHIHVRTQNICLSLPDNSTQHTSSRSVQAVTNGKISFFMAK